MKHARDIPFGATLAEDGTTRFRLWAPDAQRVVVNVESPQGARLQADLERVDDGRYELDVEGMGAGARYRYRIDDDIDVPDPGSRFNPEGIAGPSLVVDPRAHDWTDGEWRGRPWHEQVLYELHVGTFSGAGTYAGVAERLDALRDLGVTAIELMPVGAWSGRRGWGYDGVLPFAPHAPYGKPEDLKRLVQSAHERGMSVLLDVVYNHFGPEGNHLGRYARAFYTNARQTPWGDAFDLQHPVVRSFFIENALYWLEEYRFDGLRIDAVHAMHDDGPRHFIDELIERVEEGPGAQRQVHIMLENARNEAHRLGASVAQWNDDFHHPLHVLLTGETDGYYCDFADRPRQQLGRALAEGFAFQGERSIAIGAERGEPCKELSPASFVSFLQNHDQVGNRALGERLSRLTQPEALRAALAILLLSPQIPLLFMGEEYAASQPFLYFCDYQGDLARAVTDGRRAEFASFAAFKDERRRELIPDPNAEDTFARSRLDWSERDGPPHAARLSYVRELLTLRARQIVPLIPEIRPGSGRYSTEGPVLDVQWTTNRGMELALAANLASEVSRGTRSNAGVFFRTPGHTTDVERLAAWEVRLRLVRA